MTARLFVLVRSDDPSGVSGTGVVAEGVQFTDGTCILRWLTKYTSTTIYADIDDLTAIHGHDGATAVQWLDKEPT